MIFEGCYPYVAGGVSTWAQQYIEGMPQHKFILWTIGADSALRGCYKYTLPANVEEVHEVFLDEAVSMPVAAAGAAQLTDSEALQLKEVMDCAVPDWNTVFSMCRRIKNPASILQSAAFLSLFEQLCREKYPFMPFAQLFHAVRSMLLPVFYLLSREVPRADIYHSVCTGYGGLLGAMGGYLSTKPFIVTEHGIYTREREEELIRADWVKPEFKPYWTRFFYMLSTLAYDKAAVVTSLFSSAREMQIFMGADSEKCRVIANGIHYTRFCAAKRKTPDGFIDIGAIVRIAPIKDIKTLIYAFAQAKRKRADIRLHIIGPVDDKQYADECEILVRRLGVSDVYFSGLVNTSEYFEKLDFTVLSSISEGQPLAVLEAFAAHRPCVATDVGCCRELIYGGTDDSFGRAGICVPPMHRTQLAQALLEMCEDDLDALGEAGQNRARMFYRHKTMIEKYASLYTEVCETWQE